MEKKLKHTFALSSKATSGLYSLGNMPRRFTEAVEYSPPVQVDTMFEVYLRVEGTQSPTASVTFKVLDDDYGLYRVAVDPVTKERTKTWEKIGKLETKGTGTKSGFIFGYVVLRLKSENPDA